MRDLNLQVTTGSDPGISYTAMSLCATAKVFASPHTVFTQMDAAATIYYVQVWKDTVSVQGLCLLTRMSALVSAYDAKVQ